MTTITDIEALGFELPKTKDADEELGGWWGDGIKGELARKQAKRIHDDSASELLAVIERLVEQAKSDETIIATLRDMEIDENERAEQAEADLAAMTEETAATIVRLTEEIDRLADENISLGKAVFGG